jgi:hypothetical protein
MIYLITYNRNSILKNYNSLYEEIKGLGDSWWHHMNDTWLVNSNLNTEQISDRLLKHINNDDKLLIIEVKDNCRGWLNKDAWSWIQDNFNATNRNRNPWQGGLM